MEIRSTDTSQRLKRVVSVAWLILLLMILGPMAYNTIRVVKHPLDDDAVNRLRPYRVSKQEEREESPPRRLKAELVLVMPDPSTIPISEFNEIRSSWSREVRKLTRSREATTTTNVTIISKMVMYGYNEEEMNGASREKEEEEVVTKLHRLIEFENLGDVHESGDAEIAKLNFVLLLVRGNRRASNESAVKSFVVPEWGIAAICASTQEKNKTSPSLLLDEAFNSFFVPYLNEKTRSNSIVNGSTPYVILKKRFNRALSSLQALASLSRGMAHMEITASVASTFNRAVELLTLIKKSDTKGAREANLAANLRRVEEAAECAEAVDKDPTTIPQLYVSDENLLAVFSPLIVPFVLPLILSFVGEVKRWRRTTVVKL